MSKKNRLIIVLGPTAIGKTATAIHLAKHFGSDVISCDSRQFYKEMCIGTAVPSAKELHQAKHHFIGHISVKDYYNASMFEMDVLDLLPKLFEINNTAIMVGGSGMYIDAVCQGIDDLPTIEPELRNSLYAKYQQEGIESIRQQLKVLDPEHYKKVDLKNPLRILKGIEVSLMTGKPYSSFLNKPSKTRDFSIIKIGLQTNRDMLYKQINNRVDTMIKAGLIEEAREIMPLRGYNPLKTVGYRELFNHFDGVWTLDKAIDEIKKNTRHYAKRQITWFNRYGDINWFATNKIEDILRVL
ncbi:MAG: tRNA (adenosine(37)-N6)-dimethylallyltransferase MiaA [Bacteroidales bacterium]|nr:tRNA (adenosine(37)-N6)-dimethylallyltransferase MiaA [Bacteroidales bacterium]